VHKKPVPKGKAKLVQSGNAVFGCLVMNIGVVICLAIVLISLWVRSWF